MRSLSVYWKITLLAGLCLVLTSCFLIGFSIYNATSNQRVIIEHSSSSVIDKSQQILTGIAKINSPIMKAITLPLSTAILLPLAWMLSLKIQPVMDK